VEQVTELEAQPVVVAVSPGGCKDRRCVSSHSQTIGGVIELQPLAPGFITVGVCASASGAEWSAVRSLDGHPFVLKVLAVTDLAQALALAREQMAAYTRIGTEHLVGRHGAIATADGRLALVLDEVTGGSLAQLLAARGRITPGETVTTVAPLFRALADLHAAGVVHGELAPGNILFSAQGRPLIGDLGVSRLMGSDAGPPGGVGSATGSRGAAGGFRAPELAGGAAPSPASDVYGMAALGLFCLTGAAPGSAVVSGSITSLSPETPLRLVEVLTACLATNPASRPSASAAAVEVFESVPAESVALAPVPDPAAEITRRIRAVAASAGVPAPSGAGKRHRTELVLGVVALLVVLLGAGATWFFRLSPDVSTSISVRSAAPKPSVQPATGRWTPPAHPPPQPATMPGSMRIPAPTTPAPKEVPQSPEETLTSSSSPRLAAAGLLQALVDARALAYGARSPALLDLVYAPGATKAGVDKSNIATALKNGGTYLGLSFVIKDAAFLDGTSNTARIRATILTPAYRTGQPDGRKIPHSQETLGPCIFSLTMTPDGWRILALTVP
jgi:serine/threonine protein kinase